jgi:hypothetical protein
MERSTIELIPFLQSLLGQYGMGTETQHLNIPLERKNRLGYWIIAGCILFTAATAFFNIEFATTFFASSIVGLPILWLFIRPRKGRSLMSSWGVLGRFTIYILIFGYIAIAKLVFIPLLLSGMRHATT